MHVWSAISRNPRFRRAAPTQNRSQRDLLFDCPDDLDPDGRIQVFGENVMLDQPIKGGFGCGKRKSGFDFQSPADLVAIIEKRDAASRRHGKIISWIFARHSPLSWFKKNTA
jgi:hypothetical protein